MLMGSFPKMMSLEKIFLRGAAKDGMEKKPYFNAKKELQEVMEKGKLLSK